MFMKTTCIPNLDLIPFGKGYSLNAEYIFANGDGVLCVEFSALQHESATSMNGTTNLTKVTTLCSYTYDYIVLGVPLNSLRL